MLSFWCCWTPSYRCPCSAVITHHQQRKNHWKWFSLPYSRSSFWHQPLPKHPSFSPAFIFLLPSSSHYSVDNACKWKEYQPANKVNDCHKRLPESVRSQLWLESLAEGNMGSVGRGKWLSFALVPASKKLCKENEKGPATQEENLKSLWLLYANGKVFLKAVWKNHMVEKRRMAVQQRNKYSSSGFPHPLQMLFIPNDAWLQWDVCFGKWLCAKPDF